MVSSLPAQLPLISVAAESRALTFDEALGEFAALPYKQRPYSARNWGHALHSLCSYPSKMKPAIAATLVRLFTEPDDVVLDPFAGVGTIPFEACAAARRGIGVDLSPFAYCVAAAKVNPPDAASATSYIGELEQYFQSGLEPDLSTGEPEIVEFFHPDTWREVLLARRFFIEREAAFGPDVPPAHWFTKACVAHILHGNRPYALSRRSHGIIPIPPKGPTTYKSLIRSLVEKAERMDLAHLPTEFLPGTAYLASAFDLPFEGGSVDAIITSPPFLGTTDFLRQNRLRLWFCGMSYQQRERAKAGTDFMENHKTFDAYVRLIPEFRRVMRTGGLVIFHLGVVKHIDMARGIAPLAAAAGFKELSVVYEDATGLESHGRTDRGATHQHQFLFLRAV